MNTAFAFLVPALGMVLMSFVATPDLEVICVVVLVVTFAFNGGTNAGHIQNIIGLAPNRFETFYVRFQIRVNLQVRNPLWVHKWFWKHKRLPRA